ncbi:MAG: SufD family Fe-S cluster assembly protein [Desulfoplanes sp.]|nr:SufD family Fe-S cluster assembly protein [Desulfoplanes sp.]MDD4649328.1 SufD family Fe-S cluster assembly protein [Desulfoplanes sp.]
MSELKEKNDPVNLDIYSFSGGDEAQQQDLAGISADDRGQLLMAGMDVREAHRSGTFLQFDHAQVHCKSCQKGVEVLGINDALKKYDGLPDYFWKAIDKEQDEFTRASAAATTQGGYFIRTEKGAKISDPVQSCMFIKGENTGQNVHNVIIVEEDSEVHIITGCATSHGVSSAMHLGISEIYVKKGGHLTFTMIHNWGDDVVVRPRTVGIVEEDGVFLSNYILLNRVKSVQSYPTVYLNGRGALARFNAVIVTPKGSYVDTGNRIVLNAPDTRGEIVSRTITTGGINIARGEIIANAVPAKGHLECKGLILGDGVIHAIPELVGTKTGVELSHEAAVGKIAQEEIEYLMARGLDEDEATSTIVRGFLNVDIMGLPKELKETIDRTIAEHEGEMF